MPFSLLFLLRAKQNYTYLAFFVLYSIKLRVSTVHINHHKVGRWYKKYYKASPYKHWEQSHYTVIAIIIIIIIIIIPKTE